MTSASMTTTKSSNSGLLFPSLLVLFLGVLCMLVKA